MTNYLINRLIQAIITLLIIITILFFLLNILPGDAALLAGDPRAAQNPEIMDAMRARWGLDQPIHIRYATYITNLIRGDLGVSYRTGNTVNRLIVLNFPPTIRIVILSFIFSTIMGISLGFTAAVKHGSAADIGSMIFSIFGISAPRFWIGLMLMYYFAVNLRILPASGLGDGSISYLILPSVTLGIPLIALLARTTRASVLDVMKEDYVRTARSKGLSERTVKFKHIFRNALISIITIAGLQLGTLLATTVIVEEVFSLPGLGRLIIRSIHRRDIPAVQGVIFVFALGFIIINLSVDLLYAYLDPQIKYD